MNKKRLIIIIISALMLITLLSPVGFLTNSNKNVRVQAENGVFKLAPENYDKITSLSGEWYFCWQQFPKADGSGTRGRFS